METPRLTRSAGQHGGFRQNLLDLDGADSGGLGALRAVADLKLDLLIFFEGAEARTLDLRVVDEHVGRTVFGGDEAEPLLRVEPLHSSLWHFLMFPLLLGCGASPRYSGPVPTA